MPTIHSHLAIETTQHVNLQYEIAGIGRRFIAAMLDMLLIWSYIVAVIYLLSRFDLLNRWAALELEYYIYLFILMPIGLYHPFCELIWGGKSVGKMIMGLRVVQMDGSPLALGNVLLRNMFRVIEVMASAGAIGTWAIIMSPKSQRLGDMAANTIVVVEHKPIHWKYNFDIIVPYDYEIKFQQVADLTDEDIRLISEAYEKTFVIENEWITNTLANQLRKVLRISTKMGDTELIETVLKDYQKIYGG